MESGHLEWQLEWYHGITMLSSLLLETGAFLIYLEEEDEMNMKEQIAKSIAVALKDQLTEKEIQHLFEKPKKIGARRCSFSVLYSC